VFCGSSHVGEIYLTRLELRDLESCHVHCIATDCITLADRSRGRSRQRYELYIIVEVHFFWVGNIIIMKLLITSCGSQMDNHCGLLPQSYHRADGIFVDQSHQRTSLLPAGHVEWFCHFLFGFVRFFFSKNWFDLDHLLIYDIFMIVELVVCGTWDWDLVKSEALYILHFKLHSNTLTAILQPFLRFTPGLACCSQ